MCDAIPNIIKTPVMPFSGGISFVIYKAINKDFLLIYKNVNLPGGRPFPYLMQHFNYKQHYGGI